MLKFATRIVYYFKSSSLYVIRQHLLFVYIKNVNVYFYCNIQFVYFGTCRLAHAGNSRPL